jgi:hypothetical protein
MKYFFKIMNTLLHIFLIFFVFAIVAHTTLRLLPVVDLSSFATSELERINPVIAIGVVVVGIFSGFCFMDDIKNIWRKD